MRAVYQKELKSYFYSWTGWLFLFVFLSLASLIFYLNNLLQRSSDLAPFLSMMSYVFMLLTPILVMRLMAGERRQNTDKLLASAPLSVTRLISGKFLAACTVLLLAVLLSLTYPLLLAVLARVYPMELVTAYAGFFLQGCAFIALDLMVTTRTKSTMAAAALAFGVNLFVWLMSLLASSASIPGFLADTVAALSLYHRFVPFLNAQFSPANTLFYLLFCLCMLCLAIALEQSRRARRR